MGSVEINLEQWPVVQIKVVGEADVGMVDRVVAKLHELAERRTRFINIFDLTGMGGMPAVARQRFTEDAKAHKDLYGKYLIAAVCIVPSRAVRGFLTAMQWVFSFGHPVEPVPDRETALSVARRYFEREKLAWPSGLVAAS